MKARLVIFAVATAASLGIAQCGHTRATYQVASGPRDWAAHPAILEIETNATLYAISDVHGGYDRMAALLARHGVIDGIPTRPEGATWTAGDAILVVTGDMMDKGPSSLEAIDLLRALEGGAEAAGGHVVFTLGNHEAEFFYDPENDKANGSDGVDREIRARGLDPKSVASGSDPHGAWLRARPFGARIGRWFFSHAGDTHGRTIPELERVLRLAVEPHNFDDQELIGASSLLESRGWYSSDGSLALRYAQAVGARHIVFGHQPDALGPRGSIAVAQDGALMRIDCGMSPDVNDSEGHLLRIRTDAGFDVAESLDPDGKIHEIWRGAI